MGVTIRLSVEGKRGCGYRKPGGFYLVGEGTTCVCGRLPLPLGVCPCCGGGIKPTRGITWINPRALFTRPCAHEGDDCDRRCTLHDNNIPERAALLWIGEAFYPTPVAWIEEGLRMGFSRRIKAPPRGFKVGEDLVLVAHRKVEGCAGAGEATTGPGIFHAWRPRAIEYVVKGDEGEEQLQALADRGIELVHVERRGDTVDMGLRPEEEN
jgi:hypothetical protein